MKNILITFICSIIAVVSFSQQSINTSPDRQEIILVGTMHHIPNIVKRAYKPMLRKAKRFNPDAIFVEYVPSEDIESIQFDTPHFKKLADSFSIHHPIDKTKYSTIINKDLKNMTLEDFKYLKIYFLIHKDYANFRYYDSLIKYGIKGPKKPTQNEMGDVSIKLAIAQNHKKLYSMDYQSSNEFYYKYWKACDSIGKIDGEIEIAAKWQKKLYRNDVFGTIFFGLAKQTNRKSTLASYHMMNSFEYRETENEACTLGAYWWDFRNSKMANNIGKQVIDKGFQKSIVVVGAGHIVGMKEELEKQFPQLIIKTLYK